MFERQKACSKCGRPFECGGLLGCWCRDVKLDQAVLAALREQYGDCLCPECLHALAISADEPPSRSVTRQ